MTRFSLSLLSFIFATFLCTCDSGKADGAAETLGEDERSSQEDSGFCIPNCEGKQCGDNGCGQSCGECDKFSECVESRCVLICDDTIIGKDDRKEAIFDAVQTPSGGYLAVGQLGGDLLVMQFNDEHQEEWRRSIPGGQGDSPANAVDIMPNGGYLVVGSKGKDAWVLQLDGDGKKTAEATYGDNGTDQFSDVLVVGDGSAIAVGGSWDSEPETASQLLVVKFDVQLDVEWAHSIAAGEYGALWAIAPAIDDGVIVAGYKGEHAYLAKLGTQGDTLWEKDLPQSSQATHIQPEAGGEFLVSGLSSGAPLSSKKAWVARVDADGDILWENKFGGNFLFPVVAAPAADGGYLVSTSRWQKYVGSYLHVSKLDETGETLWNHEGGFFAHSSDCWNTPYALLVSPDGHYLLAGTVSCKMSGGSSDMDILISRGHSEGKCLGYE